MALGAIPFSKIAEYARDHLGLDDDDEMDRFLELIREMDGEYRNLGSHKPGDKPYGVDVQDAGAVRDFFSELGARKKAAKKKK